MLVRDTQDARQLLQVPDLDLKQLYLLSVLRALQWCLVILILEDRIVEGYLLNEMQNVEIDYDKVNHVLEKERIRCQYIIENILE